MRISGGILKGRRTATQKILKNKSTLERLRPTSSKVREALFDILRNRIKGKSFVDLYAGTGTVGFEAISRGGEETIFVEENEALVNELKKNAVRLEFHDRVSIIKGRANEFLKKSSSEGKSYDIFFMDPPYYSEEIGKILPVIARGDLLKEDGIVVVEHFHKRRLPEKIGILELQRTYRYGDTSLTFYRKANQ